MGGHGPDAGHVERPRQPECRGQHADPRMGWPRATVQERQRETIQGGHDPAARQVPGLPRGPAPMYLGYSETVSTPQFDPLSPDVEIADAGLSTERKKKSQQINRIRSINFSNIKIDPQSAAREEGQEEGGQGKRGHRQRLKGGRRHEATRIGGPRARPVAPATRVARATGASSPFSTRATSAPTSPTPRTTSGTSTPSSTSAATTAGAPYDFTNRPKEIKPFAWMGRPRRPVG